MQRKNTQSTCVFLRHKTKRKLLRNFTFASQLQLRCVIACKRSPVWKIFKTG
ncbi:TPA: hypothetical protein ACTZ17_005821 [Bacillus cereus]